MAAYTTTSPGRHRPSVPPKPNMRPSFLERVDSVTEDEDTEGMETDIGDTSHLNIVDGRCSCCPYGYHIDLTFLGYSQTLADGSQLQNLRKIRRNKRKLRKSMEVFLHEADRDPSCEAPPDVVNSNEKFMNLVQYEETATNKILEEIDHSVDATISSIDLLIHSEKRVKRRGVDEFDNGSPNPAGYRTFPGFSQRTDHRYRTETELMLSSPPPMPPTRSDSFNSLSSQSTHSSEPSYNSSSHSSSFNQHQSYTAAHHTYVTSAQLAGNMAALLRQSQEGEGAASSDPSNISQSSLQAIREHLAVCLQRMRELEEQVKTIPVLQVRISVLKEEKRLLMLQAKAKQNKFNMRSIGVGDYSIYESETPMSPSYQSYTSMSFRSQQNGDYSPKTPPPVAPKPKPRPAMRTIGVGEGNVFESYQVATYNGFDESSNRVHEREIRSEQNTHVHEKEVRTLVLGKGRDQVDSGIFPSRSKSLERAPYKVPSRSIGVGDGDVFDPTKNVHVHEKELRTVIIGSNESVGKKTRNVGILCKAATRDVGISYFHEDAKVMTKNVAVGCNEGLVFAEGELGIGGESGSTSVHTSHTLLQQMNMAAFHTRNININQKELLLALDTMLKKNVRSVGVQCRFATEDKATEFNSVKDTRTIGCGDESVEVEMKKVVPMRNMGVEARPNTIARSCATEKVYTRDCSSMTTNQKTISKGTITSPPTVFPAATNTDAIKSAAIGTETDIKIFQALDQIKNTGCNTQRTFTKDSGNMTEGQFEAVEQKPRVTTRAMNTDIISKNKAVNTEAVKFADEIEKVEKVVQKTVSTSPLRSVSTGVGDAPVLVNNSMEYSEVESSEDTTETMEIHNQSKRVDIVRGGPQTQTTEITYSSGGSEDRIIDETDYNNSSSSVVEERVLYGSPSLQKSTHVTRTIVAGGGVSSDISANTHVNRDVRISTPSSQNSTHITRTVATGDGLKSELSADARMKRDIRISPQTQTTIQSTRTMTASGGSSYNTAGVREVINNLPDLNINLDSDYSRESTVANIHTSEPIVRERHVDIERRNKIILEAPEVRPLQMVKLTSGQWVSLDGKNPQTESETIASYRNTTGPVRRRYGLNKEIQPSSAVTRHVETQSTISTNASGGESGQRGGAVTTTTTTTRRSGHSHEARDNQEFIENQLNSMSSGLEASSGGNSDGGSMSSSGGESSQRGGAVTTTTTTTRRSGHSQETMDNQEFIENQLNSMSSGLEASSGGNSDGGSMSSSSGGTQMKVIRTVETSYVGDRPVHESSNVVLGDETDAANEVIESSTASGSQVTRHGSGSTETTTTRTEKGRGGRQVTVTETHIQRKGGLSSDNGGTLKSIMKRPGGGSGSSGGGGGGGGGNSSSTQKKEISFSEEVVGGVPGSISVLDQTSNYATSSGDEEELEEVEDEDREEEEEDEEDEENEQGGSGSESDGSESFDEGSYDGRVGEIVYSCKDDEAIEQGAPGATMYDQSIRETFELNGEMQSACEVYAQWLEDSTTITTKQLNSSINVIQQEWFKTSSHKLSNASMVEDYLTSFNEFSKELLGQIVNMADANGNTALHYAVSHCNMDIVNLVLESGVADLNKQNKAGYTAIMLASLAQPQTDDDRDVIRRLFSIGDVNARASQAGQTALMLAVSHGRLDMVKLLLNNTADVNLQDEDGSTALMCASEHGHADIVKLLLAQPDCDTFISDNDGSNAFSIAMEAGHKDVGVLLYAHSNFKPSSPVLAKSFKMKRVTRKSNSATSLSSPRSTLPPVSRK